MMTRLPTLGRDASELLTLQPGSTPYDSNQTALEIAAARSPEPAATRTAPSSTALISPTTLSPEAATEKPIIPIGVESVDEFRVEITNENASFARSSGGQIAIISKSGTNTFHGSAYWFHQNSALNANSWDNGHTPNGSGLSFTPKQPQHDNRVGLTLGGPIKKNKTFIFGNYEVRRFPQAVQVERVVPTQSLRNGILTFNGVAYNPGHFHAVWRWR